MTKSRDNWPKRKPRLKEIQGLSVNNLDYQLVQNKRKNKTLKEKLMTTKPSAKTGFQTGNTRTNHPPAKIPTRPNQL